jgi:hypothetical protein
MASSSSNPRDPNLIHTIAIADFKLSNDDSNAVFGCPARAVQNHSAPSSLLTLLGKAFILVVATDPLCLSPSSRRLVEYHTSRKKTIAKKEASKTKKNWSRNNTPQRGLSQKYHQQRPPPRARIQQLVVARAAAWTQNIIFQRTAA